MGRFGGTGRHFWLDSWILANLVQLGTQRFCKQFLNRTNDPAGRQFDQMTQAARSGCANNAEGASRTATSKETEMRLTDVARASLAELQGDYLNWLLKKEQVPWPQRSPEAQAVFSLRLDRPAYGEDVLHDTGAHILAQQRKFAPWLRSEDDVVVANALLILIGRVINMLNHQMESQGEKFQEEGGFREQLSVIRQEVMAKREQAPACPTCDAVMRKRKAKSGKNVGQEFWGCSKFPACNGVRSL